jgi:hypothetical protein
MAGYIQVCSKSPQSTKIGQIHKKGHIMTNTANVTVHELDDFPYEYTTESTKSTDDFHTYNSDKNTKSDNSEDHGDNNPYVTYFRNHPNADKTKFRYNRFFIGQQGNVWILWDITELPHSYNESTMWSIGSFIPASDDSALFVTAELYFTRSDALAAFQGKMSMLVHMDDTLTALVELQKMDVSPDFSHHAPFVNH